MGLSRLRLISRKTLRAGCIAAALPFTLRAVCFASLTLDKHRRQVFVVGNEAADADSLVSAYAMAQLLDNQEVQGIALGQIPRAEFKLRGDALKLFAQAGSLLADDGSPLNMCFWDELDIDAIKALETRKVVLTDHNRMSKQVSELFEGRVDQILDHHVDSSTHLEAKVDLDERLRSACTLVGERWISSLHEVRLEIKVLIAGTILLDTRNFTLPELTPRDRAVFDAFLDSVPMQSTAAWYKTLTEARMDVSYLSIRELFLLDMKVADVGRGYKVAFSSVFGTLRDICAKAGGQSALLKTLQDLMEERAFAVVVGLYAKDDQGSKGLTLTSQVAACIENDIEAKIREGLMGDPASIPQMFRENPLYDAQGLLEHGFQLLVQEDLEPLHAFTVRGTVTRKTLMPLAVNAASES